MRLSTGEEVAEISKGVLTAPELILSLLDSAPDPRLKAASLVSAGQLLGIDAGTMRVAAARLVKKGVLEQESRGVYRIGGRGDRLHRRVQGWHRVEDQLAAWDGRWVGVFTAHLSRSDKARLRGRERALRLKGFAALAPGLAIRPANLRGSLAVLRAELVELGLDDGALLLGIDAEDPARPVDPRSLWEIDALETRYRGNLDALAASSRRIAGLDTDAAARETLLVGRAVMRDVLVDPLLPDAMVDSALRRRMVDAMKEYDRLGKRCWAAFYRTLDPP